MLKKKKKNRKENLFESNIKFVSFYFKANTAAVGPPLSSVLGNYGLNVSKFCKELNGLTKKLSLFFLIKVYVKIDLNLKIWKIKLGIMPVTYLYRLLSCRTKLQFSGLGGFFVKNYFYISIIQFFLVIIFIGKKKKNFLINEKVALGVIKSMDMLIKRSLDNRKFY